MHIDFERFTCERNYLIRTLGMLVGNLIQGYRQDRPVLIWRTDLDEVGFQLIDLMVEQGLIDKATRADGVLCIWLEDKFVKDYPEAMMAAPKHPDAITKVN